MRDSGPGHQAGGEDVAQIARGRLLDAVGGHEDGAREQRGFRMPLVRDLDGAQVDAAAFQDQVHQSIQGDRRIDRGGQGIMDKGKGGVILLTQDPGVIGMGRDPFDAEGKGFDRPSADRNRRARLRSHGPGPVGSEPPVHRPGSSPRARPANGGGAFDGGGLFVEDLGLMPE